MHDLESYYNQEELPSQGSEAYQKQITLERSLIQDTLLMTAVRSMDASLGPGRMLRLLHVVAQNSGIWYKNSKEDDFQAYCLHHFVPRNPKITASFHRQEIYKILGLSQLGAQTLFAYMENELDLISVEYYNYTTYNITLTDEDITLCYLAKHINDFINHGIVNIRKYQVPINFRPYPISPQTRKTL